MIGRYLAVLFLVVVLGSNFTPEDVEKIDALAVGEHFGHRDPAGDGCNTCLWEYMKTGPDTVRSSGVGQCTLLACQVWSPEVKYK